MSILDTMLSEGTLKALELILNITISAWTFFADAYSAEARELGVCTLKFSVPSVLHFLATRSRQNCLNDCSNGPFEVGALPPAPELQPA